MDADKLWDWIGENTSPDYSIEIEAGGDGAVHVGPLRSLRVNHGEKTVTLSTEED